MYKSVLIIKFYKCLILNFKSTSYTHVLFPFYERKTGVANFQKYVFAFFIELEKTSFLFATFINYKILKFRNFYVKIK